MRTPANSVLTVVEQVLGDHFGHRPVRASVSFVGVDPIDILRFEPIPGEVAYLSLGASAHPMTDAAETLMSDSGPRAEVMLHLRVDDRFADVWRHLAVVAASPTVEGIVLRPDMTIDLGQPLAAASRCVGGVLGRAAIEPIPTPAGVVDVFQFDPATPAELAWARARGVPALRERWRQNQTDLLDLGRVAVRLD